MDFVDIFSILIGVIGGFVIYILIPSIKQKFTSGEIKKAMYLVEIAVKAAEQIFTESGQGSLKKEYVKKYLNSKGINVTNKDMDLMIEAAVLELTKWKKQLTE